MRYIWASEEYPEFVETTYTNGFTLSVNGTNTAVVPGATGTTVGINTVNPSSFPEFFRAGGAWEYDGYTVVLASASVPLAAGDVINLKLAVADAGDDSAFDSAILIEAGSISLTAACNLVCSTSGGVGPCKVDSVCLLNSLRQPFCSPVSPRPDGTNCASPTDGSRSTCSSGLCTGGDITPPVVTPLSATVRVPADTPGGASSAAFSCSALDDVDGPLNVTYAPIQPGGFFPLGTTLINCRATDAAGNPASATVTVTVADISPPSVFAAPVHTTAVADTAGGAKSVLSFACVARDIVDGNLPVTYTPKGPGDFFPLGITVVTCSATDAAGNTASASVTVTVTDATPPVVKASSSSITAFATTQGGSSISQLGAAAFDSVDGPLLVSYSPKQPGDLFPVGTTLVTASATDAAGNSASTTVSVIVRDEQAPSIAASAPTITVEASTVGGANVQFQCSAADIVDGHVPVIYAPKQPGDFFPVGTTVVTCSATDRAGNTASATVTVTVTDSTPPSVVAEPVMITATALTAAGGVGNVQFKCRASDLADGTLPVTYAPKQPGDFFPLGTTIVTCSATDRAGNSASATVAVAVTESALPRVTTPNVTVTASSDAPGGASSVPFVCSASDANGQALPVSYSPKQPGDAFPLGATVVTCSATDAHGNTGSAAVTVTVTDTTVPVVTASVATVTTPANVPGGLHGASFSCAAQDVVDGALPVTYAPMAPGDFFPVGTTVVTCSATDRAGNTASATISVIVSDATPPTVVPVSAHGLAPFRRRLQTTTGSVTRMNATEYAAKLFNPLWFKVLSATYTGDALMAGFVSLAPEHALASEFPDGAVVLTTGTADMAIKTTDTGGSVSRNLPGDEDVSVVVGGTTKDASSLNIVVKAKGPGTVSFSYVWATEEYPTHGYNDGMVILVNGTNTALLPGTLDPVTVRTLTPGSARYRSGGNMEFGGYSVLLQSDAVPVVAGDLITLKLAVADYSDAAYDAAVYVAPSASIAVTCTLNCATSGGVGDCKIDRQCLLDDNFQQYCGPVTDKPDGAPCHTTANNMPGTCSAEVGACIGPDTVFVKADTANGAKSVSFACTAEDLIDGPLEVTYTPRAPSSFFPLGVTVVTCSAADKSANSATATVVVTVRDVTAPLLIPSASTMLVSASSPTGISVQFNCSAQDEVDSALPVTYAPKQPGDTFPLGTTVVTCSTQDRSGNTAAANITIIVTDATPPVLTVPNATVVNTLATPAGASITFSASAVDLVDGSVPVTCRPQSGSTFALGTQTVWCNTSDAAGNTAAASFDVRVERCTWTGFLAPIDLINDNVVNATGSALSVKWAMGGMDFGTKGLLSAGYPRLVPITCGTSPIASPTNVGTYLPEAASGLGQSAPGQYNMMVRLSGLVTSGSCYRFDLRLTICEGASYGIRSFRIRVNP